VKGAPRLPDKKAEVSGAKAKNPQRFRDRKTPKKTRPVGEPYANMTETQKKMWADFVNDMPWLHSAHRMLLRLACMWAAKLENGDPEFGVSATKALSSILSKLGATPTDETRVNHGSGDEENPEDKFFPSSRPH
jgi:hypothetical protein